MGASERAVPPRLLLSLAMIVEHAPTVPFLPASVRHGAGLPGAHKRRSLRTCDGWEDAGATCEYGDVCAARGAGPRTTRDGSPDAKGEASSIGASEAVVGGSAPRSRPPNVPPGSQGCCRENVAEAKRSHAERVLHGAGGGGLEASQNASQSLCHMMVTKR